MHVSKIALGLDGISCGVPLCV